MITLSIYQHPFILFIWFPLNISVSLHLNPEINEYLFSDFLCVLFRNILVETLAWIIFLNINQALHI
ncbi:hypothetical protein ACI1VM_25295, partial [Escherichia coli]